MGSMKRSGIPKGYTLVELMIVIALTIIIATFSIPMWQSYAANTNLKTAAREVMADIFNARQRAIEENINTYIITFNTSNNNYTLSRTDTGVVLWTKSIASFGGGISINSVNFNNGSIVSFQKRGTASMGTVTLKNRVGSTATITVQITARMYVQYTMQK